MPKNGSTLHPSFQLPQRVPADVNSFGPQPQIADSMGEIPFCSIVQHVGKLRAFVYRKVFLNWPSKHRRGRAKHISRYRIELAALRTSSSAAEPAFCGVRSHPKLPVHPGTPTCNQSARNRLAEACSVWSEGKERPSSPGCINSRRSHSGNAGSAILKTV